MTEVAKLQALVSMSGIKPAQRDLQGLDQSLRSAAGQAEKSIGTFSKMGSSITGVLSGVAAGAGGALKALGAIGLASMGVQAVTGAVSGLGNTLGLGLANQMEQTRASMMAFYKDTGKVEEVLAMVKKEASSTPFAFADIATAAAQLGPVAKNANVDLLSIVRTAEALSASNPMQGFEGAVFALKEAVSGDMASIIDRFNLSRSAIKGFRESGMTDLQAVQAAMAEQGITYDLVAAQAQTMTGRWSTFVDTFNEVRIAVATPIFEALKNALMQAQPALEAMLPGLQRFGELFGTVLAGAITGTVSALGSFASGLMGFGRYIAAIVSDGDLMNDWLTYLPGPLQGAAQAFGEVVAGVMGVVTGFRDFLTTGEAVGDAFAVLPGPVQTAVQAVAEAVSGLASLVQENIGPLGDAVREVAEGAFNVLMERVNAVLPVVQSLGSLFMSEVVPAVASLLPHVEALLPTLAGLAQNGAALGTALVQLGAAVAENVISWSGWPGVIDGVATAIGVLLSGATSLLDKVSGLTGGLGELIGNMAGSQTAIESVTTVLAAGALAYTAYRAALLAMMAVQGVTWLVGMTTALSAMVQAQGLAATAQWLLNAALTANPIGVVVVALAALTAGVVIAYRESETFRNAVDAVAGALRDRFMGAVDAATAVLSAAGTVISSVVGFARSLASGIDSIAGAAGRVLGPIQGLIDKLGVLGKAKAALDFVLPGSLPPLAQGFKDVGEQADKLASPLDRLSGSMEKLSVSGGAAAQAMTQWYDQGWAANITTSTGYVADAFMALGQEAGRLTGVNLDSVAAGWDTWSAVAQRFASGTVEMTHGMAMLGQELGRYLGLPLDDIPAGWQTWAAALNQLGYILPGSEPPLAQGLQMVGDAAEDVTGPIAAASLVLADIGQAANTAGTDIQSLTSVWAQNLASLGGQNTQIRAATEALREWKDSLSLLKDELLNTQPYTAEAAAIQGNIQIIEAEIAKRQSRIDIMKREVGAFQTAATALEGFQGAVTAALDLGPGAALPGLLEKAIGGDSPQAGSALFAGLQKTIVEATKLNIEGAKAAGAAIQDAMLTTLGTPSPENIQHVYDLMADLNTELNAAREASAAQLERFGTLTADSLAAGIQNAMRSDGIKQQVGAAGVSMLEALEKALDEGGVKNVAKVGELAAQMSSKLQELPEFIRGQLGTSFSVALEDFVATPTEDLRARLIDVMGDINSSFSLIPKGLQDMTPSVQSGIRAIVDSVITEQMTLAQGMDAIAGLMEDAKTRTKSAADEAKQVMDTLKAEMSGFEAFYKKFGTNASPGMMTGAQAAAAGASGGSGGSSASGGWTQPKSATTFGSSMSGPGEDQIKPMGPSDDELAKYSEAMWKYSNPQFNGGGGVGRTNGAPWLLPMASSGGGGQDQYGPVTLSPETVTAIGQVTAAALHQNPPVVNMDGKQVSKAVSSYIAMELDQQLFSAT